VDLPPQPHRVVDVPILRRDVDVPEHHDRLVRRPGLVEVGAQPREPVQLERVLVRVDVVPVRHVEVDDADPVDGRLDHALLVVRPVARQPGRDVLERRLRRDRHAVVGLLPEDREVVAALLERLAREQLVLDLRLLQAQDVRRVLVEPGPDLVQPRTDGIHVPGGDEHIFLRSVLYAP
jgi:hypothetical protein